MQGMRKKQTESGKTATSLPCVGARQRPYGQLCHVPAHGKGEHGLGTWEPGKWSLPSRNRGGRTATSGCTATLRRSAMGSARQRRPALGNERRSAAKRGRRQRQGARHRLAAHGNVRLLGSGLCRPASARRTATCSLPFKTVPSARCRPTSHGNGAAVPKGAFADQVFRTATKLFPVVPSTSRIFIDDQHTDYNR